MFARGVDFSIALGGTFEQRSNVPHNMSMNLIFISKETHGAYNYFRTKKWFAYI